MEKVSQTGRMTIQSDTQVGHSDPIILNGKIIAQWIKVTPGIGKCPKIGWIDKKS